MKAKNNLRLVEFLSFVLLGVLAGIALNYSMAMAPWGKSDTALYFNLAKNIAAGNGFVYNSPSGRVAFVGLHPPFYSILLSLLIRLQIPLIPGIRVLNIFLCAVLLTGCGLWLRKWIHSWWGGFLPAAALFLHPDIFTAFNSAMSEPLYLVFTLASLFTLLEGLLNDKKTAVWLGLSAVLAGLAAFTRFVGVSSILFGCAAILLFASFKPGKRWLYSFLYGAIGCAPLVYWFLVKWINFPGDTIRGLIQPSNFIFRCARLFFSVLDTVIGWIPPAAFITNIRLQRGIVVGVVVLILTIDLMRNRRRYRSLFKQRDPRLLLLILALLLILCYLLVFAVSYLFSSISPDVYGRTLITLIPCLLIALTAIISKAFQRNATQKAYLPGLISAILIACFLPAYFAQTVSLAQKNRTKMDSYLLPKYANSELIREITRLPGESRLISNQAALILLYTGKYPYEFPGFTCDALKARSETPFGAGDSADDQGYREGKILALFQEDVDSLFSFCFPKDWPARELTFFSRSTPVVTTLDGDLYRYDPNTGEK